MEEIIYHIESISIALIFAVLGFFSILLYIPKKEDYRYYRYSRYTLGAAFFVMATYWGLKGNIGEFDGKQRRYSQQWQHGRSFADHIYK